MTKPIRIALEEVLPHFAELEVPRSEVNRKHSLASVIAEAPGPTGIARWARIKQDLLTEWLPLPHGIPSKDVFRRVFMLLRPEAFQLCFSSWLQTISEKSTTKDHRFLSVDGKTLRRSHDRQENLGALHLVSVWCSERGLTLAQAATAEKSNEITAIPEVLSLVDLQGATITIDATGTQTAIAQQIIAGGGDYVLALKGNQPGLSGPMKAYTEHHRKTGFTQIKIDQHLTEEKGHGRLEKRKVVQFSVPDDLPEQDRWSGLRTIGVVTLTSTRSGKQSTEPGILSAVWPLMLSVWGKLCVCIGGLKTPATGVWI